MVVSPENNKTKATLSCEANEQKLHNLGYVGICNICLRQMTE